MSSCSLQEKSEIYWKQTLMNISCLISFVMLFRGAGVTLKYCRVGVNLTGLENKILIEHTLRTK